MGTGSAKLVMPATRMRDVQRVVACCHANPQLIEVLYLDSRFLTGACLILDLIKDRADASTARDVTGDVMAARYNHLGSEPPDCTNISAPALCTLRTCKRMFIKMSEMSA